MKSPPGDPYGYRLRGDRCEGVYIQPVSNSALTLVSLTTVFEDFDVNQANDLQIRWGAPALRPHIRARTLNRRLHYRMDALAPDQIGSVSMTWPTGLLRALGINKAGLGILAWIANSTAVPAKILYVPVEVCTSPKSHRPEPGKRSLQVSILPGVELTEVYVSLAEEDEKGHIGALMRDGAALGYSYYPPDQAIRFTLPAPSRKGLFYLEIAATLKSGGSAVLPVWFLNPE